MRPSQGLRAGVDVDLPVGRSYATLAASARDDPSLVALIDQAAGRVLALKVRLGLFESPYVDPDRAARVVNSPEHRALARRAAERSVILLKNDGVLPLDASTLRSVAVIGPNAHPVHYGGYSLPANRALGVSVLDGVRAAVGDRVAVRYARGTRITLQDPTPEVEDPNERYLTVAPELATPAEEADSIAAAARLARASDVAVVVVGGNYLTAREAIFAPEHLGDRADLDLTPAQDALVRAVVETGTPTVVVLIHGQTVTAGWVAEHADAVVDGWYLGQETGTAIARVLFGAVNPAGKLPVTVPRSVGQLPAYYSMRTGAGYKGYLFQDSTPLFPFGWGLSYTTFAYADLRVDRPKIGSGETATVSVDVTNTGTVAGDEVVQLYVRDDVASVVRPEMELKGFARVTLAPGETRTVSFALTPHALSFHDAEMRRVVEPGRFRVRVGRSSVDWLETEVEVVSGAVFETPPRLF